VLLVCALNSARGDAILDWNRTAIDSVVAARQAPPFTTRSMAIVHAAMFDAANAVEGRYTPYLTSAKAPPGTSAQVAAAGAAHAVLTRLFPDQKEKLDSTLADWLAGAHGDSASAAFGATIGAETVEARANDGKASADAYRPLAMPGRYIVTSMPLFVDWARARPWLMSRPDQFRPGPPPPLRSAQWAADYNEIKSVGGKASTSRTKEQTEVGSFWTVTGAPSWNPIVRELSARGDRTLAQNARLYALVYLAAADSLIAVFDAKYHYEFWRPVTAIRNGDIDGNDATKQDVRWLPLVDNPLHPEYPCAHCINAAAVGAVLESEFGTSTLEAFSMTSPTMPGVTRRWNRLSDYVREVSNARIWSGVHFRNSTQVGEAMGRAIGDMAVRTALREK
jgi:hypothetical protein